MSNGTNWYVREPSLLGGWSDDIWGGYQPSYEAASNRVTELIKFYTKIESDNAYKSSFKEVQ